MNKILLRTVLPVLLLVTSSRILPGAAQAPPDQQRRVAEFEVIARQYEFAPSRLEVQQGDRVRILVHSEDRLHGFAIRKLKVDKLLPANGKVATIEFDAKDAGTFEIVCSESCGPGHRDMKGSLVIVAREAAQP